jgi:hypothetical protein
MLSNAAVREFHHAKMLLSWIIAPPFIHPANVWYVHGILRDQLPEPLPPLSLIFILRSDFSPKLPSLRERRDQVEISVDTYASAHCDPTIISRVLISLKEISLLPVPVTPF